MWAHSRSPLGRPVRICRPRAAAGPIRSGPRPVGRFACGWLTDATWTDDERPDRLGLIVVPADEGSAFAGSAAVPLLIAYELRPGALESCDAEPLLKRLARHRLVALVPHGWERREREPSGFVGQSDLSSEPVR